MAGGSADETVREKGNGDENRERAPDAGKRSGAPIALRPGTHRVAAALVAVATLAAFAFWRCG